MRTSAATLVEVVRVLPTELVVVTATSTLVGALVSKAEVVLTTTLPAESVEETTTGTRTPDCVASADELAETVPALMAAGVLTMVLPAEFVVVTGEAELAAMVESATSDVTIVLPPEFVVVRATVVPADVPANNVDEPLSDTDTTEPSDAVESTAEEATV